MAHQLLESGRTTGKIVLTSGSADGYGGAS